MRVLGRGGTSYSPQQKHASFTSDVRLRQRRLPLTAARGRPSLACGRHGKRKRITLVAGMRYDAMGAGAGAVRTMLGLQSPTWIVHRYAGSRVTPLAPCPTPQKGCASQDVQLSKSGACAAHPSASCATTLGASSSQAGRRS